LCPLQRRKEKAEVIKKQIEKGKGNKKLKHKKRRKGVNKKKERKLTQKDNKRGGIEDQGSDT
jgi:hypothetical protein